MFWFYFDDLQINLKDFQIYIGNQVARSTFDMKHNSLVCLYVLVSFNIGLSMIRYMPNYYQRHFQWHGIFIVKKPHNNRKTAKKLAITFSPRCSYMTVDSRKWFSSATSTFK